jgi:cytochrome b pre-mRNA-processing protein 3|tara:strand:+ start:394 stop:867 length:474 start_codon:yes stop_codon:yes gene_type:complete
MKDHYLNIYNNLIKLTRNKSLFEKLNIQDSFYDRMIVFFIHFAFFLKVYKKEDNKQYLQKLYDFVFNQIDISLQEAGHGDTTINKKMKNYVSIFHSIIKKVDYWESLKNEEKTNFFSTFFEHSIESSYFVEYFEKYRNFLTNNTLNHFTKGVISHKF